MQTTDSAPSGIMDIVWPVIAPALTPELVGAIAVTLGATHIAKLVVPHRFERVAKTASAWRAFCAGASVAIGAAAGLVAWALTAATWPIVPITAFLSGPIWRLAQALLPAKIADAFLTATDRRMRRGGGS